MIDPRTLISKYNVPGPRYTSYPTVPYWDADSFSASTWKQSLKIGLDIDSHSKTTNIKQNSISLYIHLPFCESMCTFCGCNKRITKNHLVETPYIKALLKELSMYVEILGKRPTIQQLHFGGGTPTFFSSENLETLLIGIFKIADKSKNCEFSFEGHPNNTTAQHLKMFNRNGFSRVCYGVQDYNITVQKAINRIQPFENVQQATINARKAGFESVGHDIIYGLPYQTQDHVVHTINQTISLMPDRIAFYSYAHVPWIKGNGQRGYSEKHLPSPEQKRFQYEIGKTMLLNAGYVEIGMDHFALKTDALYKAQQTGILHRNFMGYNASKTDIMIGLGVSAIGDSWFGFAQNVKTLKSYYQLLKNNSLPVMRGHILNEEDLIIRKHILNLMCRFETSWDETQKQIDMDKILAKLSEMEDDGLVVIGENSLKITASGKPYVRNVCLPFDLRLQRKKPDTKLFSMTV
ncbi:oxygen-independent coproporphyrinogen III oxidase [Sediminibacter sp. Hel_I_10]|uniref:oxygen-independent coproporphyrinogen III oxidase n=1 Tax=Sediminibacter sp. Hel_I_10 TaxID=1392490 RepID=UPI000478B12E|nr:oxygen-independent coproporphyrinogen III oxidase [Sediminibacter sp. Hel_I_10]